jgi:DNA-binding SARP family transcriptional activator
MTTPSTSTTLRRLLRAAPVLTTALGLLLAVPVALAVFIGDPLPHTWPTAHGLVHALRAPLSDAAVLHVVAVVAWLAWLHLCACLAAEALAQLGGVHVHVPLGGWNRRMAHQLIAAAVLAVHGSQGFAGSGALTHALPVAYPAAAMHAAPVPAPVAPANVPREVEERGAGATAARPTPLYQEYRVAPPHGRHHDNLWDIAGRHLGDPMRWREIFALNEGRQMPDGQRLTRANLIRPGWVLRMPADATHLSAAPEQGGPAAPATAPTEEPRAHPDDTHTADAPQRAPSDAVMPAAPASAPAQREPQPTSRPTPATPAPVPVSHASRRDPAVPIGAGITLAALGILTALERRRRVAARRRPLGSRLALPDPELAAAEARLRRDAAAAATIATTLRATFRLAAARAPHVTVRAALHHPEGAVELLHADSGPPPAPFEATRHGWSLAREHHGFLLAVDDAADAAPLLVPIGTVDGAVCYVNLEAGRLIAITGDDPQATDAVIAAIVQSVAGAPWAELAQVVVPARFGHVADGLERVDVLNDTADLLDHLTVYAERVATMVGAGTSLDEARRTGTADDIGVVLLAGLQGSELPPRLRRSMQTPAGPLLAVLAGVDTDAQCWQLTGDRLRIPGIDADISANRLDPPDIETNRRLLAQAAEPGDVPPDDPDYATLAADCPADPTSRPVAVNVLGPVEILGTTIAKRAGVRDLALYLALHRRAIPTEVLATTVWPDREFNPDLMRTRMSETRRLLDNGVVHEGRSWRMTETVGCDWQRFQALADGDEDDRRAALALVRGRPFEGYEAEWVILEGHDRHIEAAIVDLALDVGQRAMDSGDPHTASLAANVGISACPYDERLYRLGMRAAAARGASGEARNLFNALRTVLDEQIEPDGQIEPETLTAYDETVRPVRRAPDSGDRASVS